MDINKDSKQLNPDAGLGELLAKTDLLDLHWHHFPSRPTPPMHQRGSKTIDVILGSLHVAQALIHAWYLPFGEPIPLLGDHHALGIELDINILLGHKLLDILYSFHQGVNSNAYPMVKTFCKKVVS